MADWFGDSGFTMPDIDTSYDFPSNFDLGGGDFNFNWSDFPSDFNLGGNVPSWPTNFQFDAPTGWPGNIYSADGWNAPTGPGSGNSWNFNWDSLKNPMGFLKAAGDIGKTGFDAYNTWQRGQQMEDYTKAVQDYYTKRQESEAAYNKAFQDYLGRRAEWESGLAGAMGEAGAGMGEAMGEFQSQMAGWQEKIGGAMDSAKMVMGEFLSAAKPLLGESQELLVSGVAALARGEEPEAWQPLLNEIRQRGTAVGMQALVSAGMSPEAARAAVLPKVTQDAQTMVLQLAQQQIASGVQISAEGMKGLQGAGQMASAMGQIGAQGAQTAAAGINPLMQQYTAMLEAMGKMFGGNFPPMPGGPAGYPPVPQA